MSKLIVNIRGTNGSGKSTVPLQMYATDDSKYTESCGKEYTLTVFPKYKFIALGSYHNKTGGLDGIGSTAAIKAALEAAKELSNKLGYHILMEGILASTVKSTYLTMFQQAQDEGFTPIVLIYTTPPDVCIQRVYARNGGKPIKEGLVMDKYDTIMRQFDYFNENGVVAKKVNNTNTAKETMLSKFLSAVERWEKTC